MFRRLGLKTKGQQLMFVMLVLIGIIMLTMCVVYLGWTTTMWVVLGTIAMMAVLHLATEPVRRYNNGLRRR